MQLMPETADYIAHKSGGTRFERADLATPQINIAYGTWYLRYLLDKYEGNTILTLAAYNAGEGKVDEWRAEASRRGERFRVASHIPFQETRDYVGRVLDARAAYRRSYAANWACERARNRVSAGGSASVTRSSSGSRSRGRRSSRSRGRRTTPRSPGAPTTARDAAGRLGTPSSISRTPARPRRWSTLDPAAISTCSSSTTRTPATRPRRARRGGDRPRARGQRPRSAAARAGLPRPPRRARGRPRDPDDLRPAPRSDALTLPYIAGKGALHQLTLSLSAAVADKRITLNTVDPGATDTGYAPPETYAAVLAQEPFGRWGEPDDAARLIAFLCSEAGAGSPVRSSLPSGGGP